MRTSSSGGSMSASRPHANRVRRRSAMSEISCGLRSAVSTICLWFSWSALNVWKNSSCVPSLPARNWTSSIEQDVDAFAVVAAELVHLAGADRLHVLVHEPLARQVDDARAGAVGELLVADRVQQVRLAEADAAADEHRVVLRRIARRGGLRGGERELVRRTGDEGVERVARVERCGLGSRRSRRGRAIVEPAAGIALAVVTMTRLYGIARRPSGARARQCRVGRRSAPSALELDANVVAKLVDLPQRAWRGSSTRTTTGRSCSGARSRRRAAVERQQLDRSEPHVEVLRRYP